MFGLWSRYRHIITGFFLVLIPTLIFSISAEAERDENVAFRTIGYSQFATVSIVASIGDFFSGLFDSAEDSQLEQLRRENQQMREERSRLIGILQENARLRRLVGFKEGHDEFEVVPARIVSRDVTPYFNVASVRVIAGSEIEIGMPALSADGVVGVVSDVSGRFAQVRLVTDPRSRIDAVSQRNRTRGIVRGYSEDDRLFAEVGYVSANDDVKVGDVYVTSGMAGRFPKELIIGTVTEIETRRSDDAQVRIGLVPATDFGRLEELFIVTGTK